MKWERSVLNPTTAWFVGEPQEDDSIKHRQLMKVSWRYGLGRFPQTMVEHCLSLLYTHYYEIDPESPLRPDLMGFYARGAWINQKSSEYVINLAVITKNDFEIETVDWSHFEDGCSDASPGLYRHISLIQQTTLGGDSFHPLANEYYQFYLNTPPESDDVVASFSGA